jgi:hypothetical protein
MRSIYLSSALFFLFSVTAFGQGTSQKVFVADIDNFWAAYDSIQTTNDSTQQIAYIKKLYIDKGSAGLKSFMMVRSNSAEKWVRLIRQSPKFWSSIRPNTLAVKDKADLIENRIQKLKELYPQLSEAKMYFTIGGLNSGGTTVNKMILIGCEIATGTVNTDVSDLPQNTGKWLGSVFKEQDLNNIVPLNIHEYIHTQQKSGEPSALLGLAIREGSCDFITELVMEKPMMNNYIQYGRAHDNELKEEFKKEMFTNSSANWLYNGSKSSTVGDLGYYMGYIICKSYYNQAIDKKKAIAEIIELNYSDSNAIENFLAQSKYYNEKLDKKSLVEAFETKRPSIVSIDPLKGDSVLDATVQEMTIVFSEPMRSNEYSINPGKKGKESFPFVDVVGFSTDKKSLTLKMKLETNRSYEFVIPANGFTSASGYPLRRYVVKFSTK